MVCSAYIKGTAGVHSEVYSSLYSLGQQCFKLLLPCSGHETLAIHREVIRPNVLTEIVSSLLPVLQLVGVPEGGETIYLATN